MLIMSSTSKSYPSLRFPLTVISDASPLLTFAVSHCYTPYLIIFSNYSLLSVLSSHVPAWFHADYALVMLLYSIGLAPSIFVGLLSKHYIWSCLSLTQYLYPPPPPFYYSFFYCYRSSLEMRTGPALSVALTTTELLLLFLDNSIFWLIDKVLERPRQVSLMRFSKASMISMPSFLLRSLTIVTFLSMFI
jgi:hypothetical protein